MNNVPSPMHMCDCEVSRRANGLGEGECTCGFDGTAALCRRRPELRSHKAVCTHAWVPAGCLAPGAISLSDRGPSDRKKRYLTESRLPFSYHKVQHLCLCFRVICNSFRWTVHILCPFFCWFVHFFLTDLWEYFLYRENELFVHDRSCKYFPRVCHLLLSCLWVVFFHVEVLYSWRHQSVLWLPGVRVVLRKYLANTSPPRDYIFLNLCDFLPLLLEFHFSCLKHWSI